MKWNWYWRQSVTEAYFYDTDCLNFKNKTLLVDAKTYNKDNAIVLDLNKKVLNNSTYQDMTVKTKKRYSYKRAERLQQVDIAIICIGY